MKRMAAALLALLLWGCGASAKPGLATRAEREKETLLEAAAEMRAMGMERVYVSLGTPTKQEEDGDGGDGETAEPDSGVQLIRYEKAGGDKEAWDSPVLERALREFDFVLILFQTAADGRESVVFSTGKETAKGLVQGVSVAFDENPVAWWGRSGTLIRRRGRFVEINPKGDAWYFTSSLGDGLWYWEKCGEVLG